MSKVFDSVLRPAITAAAKSDRIKETSQRLAVTERVVRRFVPGESEVDVLAAIRAEFDDGLSVTIDFLGEDTVVEAQADATVTAYLSLLEAMSGLGATASGQLEVSLKLTALGQSLPEHGAKIAEANARRIASAARAAGVLVTVDAEDHTTVDERLSIVRSLRGDFPEVGTVLQAYLRRTEDDCAEFAASGARIRLCKGAYAEPASVAFPDRRQIDEAYLRCLRILMKGNGYPMVASHDPVIIEAAGVLARELGREPDSWEHQMLYGIRTDEQRRLVQSGARVRVYIPYGEEWYGYFVRRLAEKPANLGFFLRALAG
ncbi:MULTISPECIES: proline dehydrogenase family protein [unclassified Gordonia (in: high G+C Gram-positive bacteria)]|uniref:proline dehydrogenase family protein n=1 Tax=unclassified Gordonia (in: high G+C Gram-positive bacteria) TaxID=2657482 RepID=UPI001F0DBC61|nr:proline dehydrogenase family protein [Gordonia sp. ABSL49_1]MCH5643139.1 proline dehydrogenase family protein [Gordonia sp. ABSL49_1]